MSDRLGSIRTFVLNVKGRRKTRRPSHGFVALPRARGKAAELGGWLLTKGAERVSIAALEQTFAARNAFYDALEKRIFAAQA